MGRIRRLHSVANPDTDSARPPDGRQPAGRLFSGPSSVASPPCSTVRRVLLPPSLLLFRLLACSIRRRSLPLRHCRRQLLYMYNFYLFGFPPEISAGGRSSRRFEQAHPLPPACAFSQSCRRAAPPASRLGGIFVICRVVSSSVSTSSFSFSSKNSFKSGLIFVSSLTFNISSFGIFTSRVFI